MILATRRLLPDAVFRSLMAGGMARRPKDAGGVVDEA
jgi:hypothetical protein